MASCECWPSDEKGFFGRAPVPGSRAFGLRPRLGGASPFARSRSCGKAAEHLGLIPQGWFEEAGSMPAFPRSF